MIRISRISRIFGRVLPKLFDKGLNAKSFHCVGHSFGAHSCGIMGRELYQVSDRKYKLKRFVFCCAWSALFDETILQYTESLDLIQLVQAFIPHRSNNLWPLEMLSLLTQFIVTCFSSGRSIKPDTLISILTITWFSRPAHRWRRTRYSTLSHVRFNYDSRIKDITIFVASTAMCSHFNAVRYWVDALSVKTGKLFPSYQCSNWEDFESKKCKNNFVNYMGIEATSKNRGKFFIKLHSKHHYNGRAFYRWLLRRIEQRAINILHFNF